MQNRLLRRKVASLANTEYQTGDDDAGSRATENAEKAYATLVRFLADQKNHQTTAAQLEKPQFALGRVVTFAPHQSGSYDSGSSVCRSHPPKDKEVAAAERAPKGQKNPVESCFKGIPISHASEIDRPAMWAPRKEHTLQ